MTRPPKASRSGESWLPLMSSTGTPRARSSVRKPSSSSTASTDGTDLSYTSPGDEHAVRLLVVQNGEDLPQDVRLILKHGKSVDTLAEMQVGEVEKFHRIASLLARPGRGVMLPL